MRIYDNKNKQSLDKILIMLTPKEVQELLSKLKYLDSINNDHIHVDDENYRRLLTIGLYTPENIQNFSDEVIKLIKEEE